MAVEDTNERFVEAVAKLLQLTQQRSIRWSPSTPEEANLSAIPDPNTPFRNVYIAQYLDRNLRLYEKQVVQTTLAAAIWGKQEPSKQWRVFLDLSEITGKGWWSFPRIESTADLMRAVQYQVSGVDDFVDSLMKL